MTASAKLIFVYNAEAGLVQGMLDSLHKTLSPDTYDCALCAITHGFFTMDKTWRAYLKALPVEAVFHHRSDFKQAYPDTAVDLPAILLAQDGVVSPLVAADEFMELTSVNDLCAILDARLADKGLVRN